MPSCCAYNCGKKLHECYAVFLIPQGKRDVLRREQWLLNIGRKNFVPTKNSVVCELHFTEDQFEPRILKEFGKKKLKPNAIPTLFSHRPTVKQEKPPQQEPNIDNSCTATLWLPLNDTSKMRSTTSLSESSSPSQDCLELPDGCYKPVLIEASSQELLECKDKFECTDDDAERK
ncbi:THAP domain-containing protein 1-like isoform X1 [Rhipicephalus microplus]|uniref:THAP domain-containing protein 1-like isoform X1 n=1 Tax=Rhipicephalus microplus TaxID=6941 RepID=UPI002376B6A6